MKRANRERGVTLTELMVATVVLGLVIGAILRSMITVSSLADGQTRVVEANSAGRFAVSIIGQDLQSTAYGGVRNCENEPRMQPIHRQADCPPLEDATNTAMQAVRFDDNSGQVGAAAGNNPQFLPDTLWVLVNPTADKQIKVTARDSGSALHASPADVIELAAYNKVLGYQVFAVEEEQSIRLRSGLNSAGGAVGGDWVINVNPALAEPISVQATITPLAWVRYRLRQDPDNALKTDLVREEFELLNQPATRTDVVATYVVDLQYSFCIDQAYDPSMPPQPPVIVCGVTDENTINLAPEKVRTVEVQVRTRESQEDRDYHPVAAQWLTGYDLNGNVADGVSRVRTYARTLALWNMGL